MASPGQHYMLYAFPLLTSYGTSFPLVHFHYVTSYEVINDMDEVSAMYLTKSISRFIDMNGNIAPILLSPSVVIRLRVSTCSLVLYNPLRVTVLISPTLQFLALSAHDHNTLSTVNVVKMKLFKYTCLILKVLHLKCVGMSMV